MKKLLQNLGLIVLGLFLGLVILELGMRVAGYILSQKQESQNQLSLSGGEKYVIVCLGESTTVIGNYPRRLQELLNQWAGRDCFAVINKGIPGTDSAVISRSIKDILDKYQPNMVIGMIGINDPRRLKEKGSAPQSGEDNPKESFYAQLKVYKLLLALIEHIHPILSGQDLEMEQIYAAAERDRLKPIVVSDEDINLARARDYWDEDCFGEVEYICRCLLEQDPFNREIQILLGKTLGERGSFSEASEIWAQLRQNNPADREGILNYARLLSLQQEYSGAAEQFIKAEELNPKAAEAPAELAIVYLRQGNLDQALVEGKKAIDLAPSRREWFKGPLRQKIREFIRKGQWAQAIKIGNFAHSLGVEDAAILSAQGRAYNYLGDRKQAEQVSCRALELDPGQIYALETLGVVNCAKGNFSKGEDYFLKAMRAHLKHPGSGPGFPFNELTGLYLNRPRPHYDKLELLCREVLEKCPEDERVIATLAHCLEARGAKSEAGRYRIRAKELMDRLEQTKTKLNYRKIVSEVQNRGIKMVCVQYPIRPLRHLKNVLGPVEGMILVDNEDSFRQAVEKEGVKAIFTDLFAGDFGHFSSRGVELLAGNISKTLISSGIFEGLKVIPTPSENQKRKLALPGSRSRKKRKLK